MLADKLLAKMDYDCDREIRTLELLKIRFGDSNMHNCEVCLLIHGIPGQYLWNQETHVAWHLLDAALFESVAGDLLVPVSSCLGFSPDDLATLPCRSCSRTWLTPSG